MLGSRRTGLKMQRMIRKGNFSGWEINIGVRKCNNFAHRKISVFPSEPKVFFKRQRPNSPAQRI